MFALAEGLVEDVRVLLDLADPNHGFTTTNLTSATADTKNYGSDELNFTVSNVRVSLFQVCNTLLAHEIKIGNNNSDKITQISEHCNSQICFR